MSRIFGNVRQNGYVVHDIHSAMRHWSETLGVGPFFYVKVAPIENFHYMGEPSGCQCSIALANSGDLQIELIQQLNDEPSMYRDFLAAGREGLQHIAYWTEKMDEELARIAGLGYRVGQSGTVGENGRFVYYTTQAHPGTVVELSEISGRKGQLFRAIRDAAAQWDGTNPIIEVG